MGQIDRRRIAAAVAEILAAVGEDVERAGLQSTPDRVADAYGELFSGLGEDPAVHLSETYPVDADASSDLVIVSGLEFTSVCEHHLLPFSGTADIAYLPSDRIAGLGRFSAVLDSAASRPQLQERLGASIADVITTALGARGVLVRLTASHGCMMHRGPRQRSSATVTVSVRGELTDGWRRAEASALLAADRRSIQPHEVPTQRHDGPTRPHDVPTQRHDGPIQPHEVPTQRHDGLTRPQGAG